MTKKELLALRQTASPNPNLKLTQKGFADEAYLSNYLTLNKHKFNTSYFCVYTLASNKHVNFVTVLSYYNDQYILKCSDPYLEGSLKKETFDKLLKSVLDMEAATYTGNLATSLKASYGIAPKSTSCHFNQNNFVSVGPICDHIAQFLHDMPTEIPDKLFQRYSSKKVEEKENKQGNHSSLLDKKFNRYAFKKHLLLEGDKGSGKTYFATQWGKDQDIKQIFIGGHEQFESIDFLGHFIQRKDGSLLWKDGALSQAFRLAKKGIKTILIIDEMLRIPKRELNLLISALSATRGEYTLRTGRAIDEEDNIAIEEVLHAPVENFWVIGTTNVGDAYAVDEIDEALIDRFKPIRKETNHDEIQSILIKTALQKRFGMEVVHELMAFYKKMEHMRKTKLLNHLVNLRHLQEALEFSQDEEEVKEIIMDSSLLWVDRDSNGEPNKEQLATVNSVISAIWK